MSKYIYVAIIIAVFSALSLIMFYRTQSIDYENKFNGLNRDYKTALSKIDQQEASIKDYKKSIKEQTEKLVVLNDKKLSYENDYNNLKQTLDLLNLDEEIKKNPEKINIIINKTINDKFKKIEDATK